jgi:hypothetical protein
MMTKKHIFQKIPDNGFKILACFTRSIDEYHKSTNRIHLISSIVLTRYEFHISLSMIRSLSLSENNYKNKYYVFNIVDENDSILEIIDGFKCFIEHKCDERLVYIHLPISTLLGLAIFENDDYKVLNFYNKNLKTNVFGEKDLKEKNFDILCQDSVFIFSNEY